MRDTRPTNSSKGASSSTAAAREATPSSAGQWAVLWRVGRYLALRGTVGSVRLAGWAVVQSVLLVRGLLALMASPASSGRSPGEFKDMYRPDSPNAAQGGSTSDGFWRMYFQAYTPRAWRMRRLFPMSVGRKVPRDDSDEEDG
ncbi:MAG TPA: hypothetical protein VI855_00700 [Dehalococcoidia bacterium]|nr:hypothetical protein [Dehalococcoidia bacterium]